MPKAGKKLHQKRVSAPTTWPVYRKGTKYLPKISPGAHSKETGMPLIILLKEVLGIVKTAKEAKYLLNSKQVLIDGKVRNRERLPVGHMDIVEFENTDMRYLIQLHTSKKLHAKEISEEQAQHKICRVTGKRNIKGGLTQISLHDGRNILLDNKDKQVNDIKVQHSLKITIPNQEIKEIYPLDEGSRVLVTKGHHMGKIGSIMEITRRYGPMASEVIMMDESNDEQFRTALDYIFVVGKELELDR